MQNLNSRKFPMALALAAVLMTAAEAQTSTGGAGAETTEPPKEKVPGVGDLAKQLLREGKTNKEVLEAIKLQFPDAKTSMSSVNWYRNNLRSMGEDVKTAREIAAAGKPTAEEKKAAKEKAKAEKKAEREKAAAEKKAEKKAAKEKAEADKATSSNSNAGAASTADMMA